MQGERAKELTSQRANERNCLGPDGIPDSPHSLTKVGYVGSYDPTINPHGRRGFPVFCNCDAASERYVGTDTWALGSSSWQGCPGSLPMPFTV